MVDLQYKKERAKSIFLTLSPFLILFILAIFKPLFVRPVFRALPSDATVTTAGSRPGLPSGRAEGSSKQGGPILAPVSLLDDVFKGFISSVAPGREARRASEASVANTTGDKAPGIPQTVKMDDMVAKTSVQPVVSQARPAESAIQKELPVIPKTTAQRSGRPAAVGRPLLNPPPADRKPGEGQDAYLRQIDDFAGTAGLPAAKRREMVQSYEDLSRIMPKNEARKIVIMKIRTERG